MGRSCRCCQSLSAQPELPQPHPRTQWPTLHYHSWMSCGKIPAFICLTTCVRLNSSGVSTEEGFPLSHGIQWGSNVHLGFQPSWPGGVNRRWIHRGGSPCVAVAEVWAGDVDNCFSRGRPMALQRCSCCAQRLLPIPLWLEGSRALELSVQTAPCASVPIARPRGAPLGRLEEVAAGKPL